MTVRLLLFPLQNNYGQGAEAGQKKGRLKAAPMSVDCFVLSS